MPATERIVARRAGRGRAAARACAIWSRSEIRAVFDAVERPAPANGHRPHVTLIVGVNGTGKTTTIGKLANLLEGRRASSRSSARPTRSARRPSSSSQIWAKRAGVDIVRAQEGSDPGRGGVRRDLSPARRAAAIPILVDTAGRLHTRVNLMNELDKIRRVAARAAEGAPHEVLLVLDATVGQNGLQQAREFTSVAGVTGIVLTKLDGTAKGGVAVAIAHDLKLPIRYVGVGEGIDDLIPFSPDEYVDALFQRQVVDDARPRPAAARLQAGATAGADAPAQIPLSAQSWPRQTGRSWARATTRGPARRMRRCTRSTRQASGRAARRLYCTLEPCCHTGRTGPCAERIVAAGIRRVVAAATRTPTRVWQGAGSRICGRAGSRSRRTWRPGRPRARTPLSSR